MKTNKVILFQLMLFVISSAILFSACGVKKGASGKEDEIFVITDSSEYHELESTLMQVFSKVIYTPQPEHLFNLTRKNYNDLENLKEKKNIIIIAPLNSGSFVSQYINAILDSSVKSMVENNKEFVFNKYNLWADNQLVMILTSPTIAQLEQNILRDHDNLIYYFQKESNSRLFKSLYYEKYEKKDIEAQLLNKYGWIIYVQADFQLSQDKPEDNFVWLRRGPGTDMERWIFVHWIDNASPSLLNTDTVMSVRNKLTKKYYRTTDDKSWVQIADDYHTSTEVNFLNRYALMTQGLWRFSDMSGVGPFINYSFYDEKSKRLYILDGSIFAPKYPKRSLIQQVDVTLQSFMTKDELSADKIEDLMDELE